MTSIKREAGQASEGTEIASKRVKREAALEVNVQLKCFIPKFEDDEDDEEDEEDNEDGGAEDDDTFVDARAENSEMSFAMLGSPTYNYDCSRVGRARIMVNGVKVGEIRYTLIDRTMLGGGLDFHEVCDAESAELETIASYFFKPGSSGLLNRNFLNRMVDNSTHAMVNHGCFMYVSSFLLDAPYDRSCSEENSMVATTAIEQFIHSPALQNEGIEVSLIMYIPEGWVNPDMRDLYNDELMRKDIRSFERAGFRSIRAGDKVDHLFFEMP